MTDPRWQRIKDMFAEAASLPSAERRAFLERACADDPDARREVESLLAAHPPSVGAPEVGHSVGEGAGSSVGPYRLLEEIGEGGFGTVYLAEQEAPVRRRVALKVIKAGMDTRQVIARFEQERQALAMMDHPGIARVLDGGETESGRPYFVMELVRGDPITEYCDRERLATRERLELFVDVCRAVQHAHVKGVIHRDIKPSNVLVTIVDGRPAPKVIDFGVAKATQGPLTNKTLFTEHRQVLGTPLYMSPEQASLSGVDVDTRSDVYSLGVLLYELLTGVPPLDQSELMQAGLAEICRMIRELEPKKPSTRLATMGPASTGIAKHRQIEAKKLGLLLRGDLDWIAMRCLEKERARRYGAASDVARDIQRHLDGEPIEAAPPSAMYRARKLVRRRKSTFVAAAAVLFVAVLGISSTLSQARRAQQLADRSLIVETQRADEAVRVAAEQRALREEADAERAEAEAQTYVANIASAEAARLAGDANTMRARLDACPADHRGWEWRNLHAQADMAVAVLRGRRALLDIDWEVGVAPHASGEFSDLWDAECLCIRKPPTGVQPENVFAASSAAGLRLVAGFEWVGENQPIVRVVRVDEAEAHLVAQLTLAPCDERRPVQTGYDLVVGGFSPDGRWLMTLAPAASCEIWNTTTWTRSCTLPEGYWTFSNDGALLLRPVGRTAEIVDPANGRMVARLATHDSRLASGHFSPDGTKVVTTSVAGVVRIWDPGTGAQLAEHSSNRARILDAVFLPDNRRVATAGQGSMIEVWDPTSESGEVLAATGGFAVKLPDYRELAISPNGLWIAATGYGNTVDVWNTATGERTVTLLGHETMAYAPIFSADSQFLATTGVDGTKRIWNEACWTNRGFASVRPNWGSLYGAEWDGGWWATSIDFALGGAAVVVDEVTYDLATGFCLESRLREFAIVGIPLPDYSWNTVHPAPRPEDILHTSTSVHGTRRVTVSRRGEVLAWDQETGTTRTLVPADPAIWSAHLSPDGDRVLLSSPDPRVVDASSGATLIKLAMHGDELYRMTESFVPYERLAAWSPDGARVLALRDKLTPCLWDTATGNEIARLNGHTGLVITVAFSPDGRLAVTGSHDHTVRVWDARSGKELRVLTGHTQAVRDARFSPDGNYIASVADDGTWHVWDGTSRIAQARAMHAMIDARARMRAVVARLDRSADHTAWQLLQADPAVSELERRAAASLLVDAESEREHQYVDTLRTLLAGNMRIDQAEAALLLIEANLDFYPGIAKAAEARALALCRSGRSGEVFESLAAVKSPSWIGRASLALAHCRAEQVDEATKMLAELRDDIEHPDSYLAKEAVELLAEVEALYASTFPAAH